MKVINEVVENAYMIRNDGKTFKMLQHVYGSKEEIEETLAASEWLYGSTAKSTTKKLVIDLLSTWGYFLNPNNDIVENILLAISERPYRFLTKEFINSISDHIRDGAIRDDINALNDLVVDELNQEFLRVRYGGMYNSSVGNHEMVFRVSSIGFNWFNIIFKFVCENKTRIDSVTVVKDEESTGFEDVYSHAGHKMYKMPIEEFIMLPGNPIVESFNKDSTVVEKLTRGMSIIESTGNKINMRRLVERYERTRYCILQDLKEM